MEISQVLLTLLAIVLVAVIACFLMYGMIRGVQMEKEMRLRNRRRYS